MYQHHTLFNLKSDFYLPDTTYLRLMIININEASEIRIAVLGYLKYQNIVTNTKRLGKEYLNLCFMVIPVSIVSARGQDKAW